MYNTHCELYSELYRTVFIVHIKIFDIKCIISTLILNVHDIILLK